MESHSTLVVFELCGRAVAVPAGSVYRIVPMAQLAHPPGLPLPLEGILNLAGEPVPVLRLERLLQMPVEAPRLFSALIVLKDLANELVAIVVDRVTEVVSIPPDNLLGVSPNDSLNGLVEATASWDNRTIHMLSTRRILLEKERQSLSDLQTRMKQRIEDWETAKP